MVLVQSGDHRAFSNLYDRYSSGLNAFFYRMLWSDRNMSEDCVQDLFSRVAEKSHLFKPEYSVKPWLFRIAGNICKNVYRKKAFETEYLNQLKKQDIQLPEIEKQIDEKIMIDQIYVTLGKLDEDRRLMFLMRYQQEMTLKELAEVFEIAEGTVKSRLFHIKQFLSRKLIDHPKLVGNGE